MNTAALYDLAKQQNIEILRHPMPENGSMSVMLDNGACFIGMDDSVCDGSIQERVHLAHELGHCATGSFYNIHAAVDCRERHENRATKWAIQNLIPIDALDQAIANGNTEIWQLADLFEVPEEFIRRAICYYTYGNVAAELYF